MRQIKFLLVLILVSNSLIASAEPFTAKYHAKVTKYDTQNISLTIADVVDAEPDSFKPGTVLSGTVTGITPRKRISRDETLIVHLTSAKSISGEELKIDRDLQIRPRRLLSVRNEGSALIGATGLTLGLTIDFLTVGLPVGRGALALWNAGFEAKGARAGRSKTKAAAKGFIWGALFPLPQLLSKGKSLDINDKDLKLTIFKTRSGKTIHAMLN